MKKIARIATLTAAGLMFFAFTTNLSDNSFEGVITYTIKVDSDNPQVAQFTQGMTVKTYIKGDKSRTESNSAMYKRITIMDRKNPDAAVTLVDVMGNKYQVKTDDKDKTKKESDDKPEIKYLDGTKTIAGYACKEAQAIVTDSKTGTKYTTDIYYTDQLPFSNEFKGLKGFPLSFSMKQNEAEMSFVAQSIQKQSVPDSLFAIPSGYKLMTADEMQKDMMQKMSGGGGQ